MFFSFFMCLGSEKCSFVQNYIITFPFKVFKLTKIYIISLLYYLYFEFCLFYVPTNFLLYFTIYCCLCISNWCNLKMHSFVYFVILFFNYSLLLLNCMCVHFLWNMFIFSESEYFTFHPYFRKMFNFIFLLSEQFYFWHIHSKRMKFADNWLFKCFGKE